MEVKGEYGFKSEIVRMYAYGYMLKRMMISKEAHKAFLDERAMRIVRDVFMYKNMKQCEEMYRIVEGKSSNVKVAKDKFKELSIS